ncbi:MAG TPA: DUF3617 family protein [Pseudolabrys sp.]|jgi:hypothetical protein|nr:DUF3617 family protein [Pseudolabrys sp.]
MLALLAAVPAARAATVIEPGLWQDTETGTENGSPVKPRVETGCISAKDAEDPSRQLMAMQKAESARHCRKMEVHRSAQSFSIDMSCGDPRQFAMDMVASFMILDRKHYSGHVKTSVVLGGHKSESDKQIDSKWIGVCKK